MNCTYFNKRKMNTTWEQLLLTADSDFVAFILLSYCGISDSTSLWMAPHSIEKYLKSLLLKTNSDFNCQSYSHKLNKLWGEARRCFPEDGLFERSDYQTFVNELNVRESENPSIRYEYGIEIRDPLFLKTYIVLACSLRRRILGEQQYRERGPFGLCDASFGGSPPFVAMPIDVKKLVCDVVHVFSPTQ